MPEQTITTKRLVTESLVSEMRRVDEKGSGKPSNALCIVEGPCMEFGKVNQNNRIYSRKLIEDRIINYPPVKEAIKNKCMLGEGGHPETRIDIAYSEVALSVERIWIPDNSDHLVFGRFAILDTPVGRILKTLIDYGSKIGISARALAESKMEGNTEVMSETEYDLITFDAVPDPGFKCAHLEKVQESKSLSSMTTNELRSNVAALFALKIPAFESRMRDMAQELEKRTDDVVNSVIRNTNGMNALTVDRKDETNRNSKKVSINEIMTSFDVSVKSSDDKSSEKTFESISRNSSDETDGMKIARMEQEIDTYRDTIESLTEKIETLQANEAFLRRSNESLRCGIEKDIYQASYLERYSELACKAEALARKLDSLCKRSQRIVRCVNEAASHTDNCSQTAEHESSSTQDTGKIRRTRFDHKQMKTEASNRSGQSQKCRRVSVNDIMSDANKKRADETTQRLSKRYRIDADRLTELADKNVATKGNGRSYERRVRSISNFERDVHEIAPARGVFLTGKGK